MSKKKVTREAVEELHYNQGLRIREVADILDCHPVSVFQAMRKMGMKGRVHWIADQLTKEKLEELILGERMNVKEIAERYRISDCTVRALIQERGLDTPNWRNSNKDYRWIPGEKVGNFEIIKRGKTVGRQLQWFVKCNLCGGTTHLATDRVITNKSCGCLKQNADYYRLWGKMIQRHNTTHGLSRHPLYHSWLKILKRCNDPNYRDYPNYGGKGITCEFEDIADFVHWAIKKGGWERGKHCHRIDNTGPYSPDNCIFMAPGDHSRLHWKQRKANKAATC